MRPSHKRHKFAGKAAYKNIRDSAGTLEPSELCTAPPDKSLRLLQRLHRLLDLLLPVVELVLQLLRDLLEQLLREDPQQRPGDVQRGEDVTVLVGALRQELGLELVRE